MNTFLTSDLHFGHANIIRYCNRPFSNVEEMDNGLIENWNAVVTPTDQVFVLGDMFFCSETRAAQILNRLNGKIALIPGNHDDQIMKSASFSARFWKILPALHMERRNGQDVSMSHYPMLSWRNASRGAFMLHGHVHSSVAHDSKIRRYDVGVDANGFTPVHWDHIVNQLSAIPPVDYRTR